MEESLPWERWICYLAVSLDLEEIDQYYRYLAANGDPKKWKWATADHAGTRPGGVSEGVMEFAKAMSGGKMEKKDPYEYGKATGKQMVYKMAKWDIDTGRFIGYVYVDEQGSEVDIGPEYRVVETSHPEAQEKAKSVIAVVSKAGAS